MNAIATAENTLQRELSCVTLNGVTVHITADFTWCEHRMADGTIQEYVSVNLHITDRPYTGTEPALWNQYQIGGDVFVLSMKHLKKIGRQYVNSYPKMKMRRAWDTDERAALIAQAIEAARANVAANPRWPESFYL
jgi:spore coat polysaccharide biosynthesis protein SpsF (cytidylyltransferase family)